MLASGSSDSFIQVMNIATGAIIYSLPYNGLVSGIAWEPGNTGRLATTSTDGSINVWDVHSSTRTSYKGHTAPVTSIAWGTNALATGSTDTTIIIWEI